MSTYFDNEMETPEMETLSSLADNVVYLVPGCTDIMIRKTLQETYRDFCRRSCCLCGRRLYELEQNQAVITVAPKYSGIIDSVTYVKYNRRMLGGVGDYDIRKGNPPVVCLAPRLVPKDVSNLPEVEIGFVEIPKLNSENVPQWFIEKHGEDIIAGVLAKLMSMTGKAWSDPTQAQVNRIIYENAVGEARVKYYAGSSYGNGDYGLGVNTSDLI